MTVISDVEPFLVSDILADRKCIDSNFIDSLCSARLFCLLDFSFYNADNT